MQFKPAQMIFGELYTRNTCTYTLMFTNDKPEGHNGYNRWNASINTKLKKFSSQRTTQVTGVIWPLTVGAILLFSFNIRGYRNKTRHKLISAFIDILGHFHVFSSISRQIQARIHRGRKYTPPHPTPPHLKFGEKKFCVKLDFP